MKFINTKIDGCFLIEQNHLKDERGSFVKMFQKSFFEEKGINEDFKEFYYTKSKEDVIRGMHCQTPPHEHSKIITVIQGTVIDVILDLRKNSKTFKSFFDVELSRENRKSIYVPTGCLHGFGVLSDTSIVTYLTSSEYKPDFDTGIQFDSFGYDWIIKNPILSDRDQKLIELRKFKSPF